MTIPRRDMTNKSVQVDWMYGISGRVTVTADSSHILVTRIYSHCQQNVLIGSKSQFCFDATRESRFQLQPGEVWLTYAPRSSVRLGLLFYQYILANGQ